MGAFDHTIYCHFRPYYDDLVIASLLYLLSARDDPEHPHASCAAGGELQTAIDRSSQRSLLTRDLQVVESKSQSAEDFHVAKSDLNLVVLLLTLRPEQHALRGAPR